MPELVRRSACPSAQRPIADGVVRPTSASRFTLAVLHVWNGRKAAFEGIFRSEANLEGARNTLDDKAADFQPIRIGEGSPRMGDVRTLQSIVLWRLRCFA